MAEDEWSCFPNPFSASCEELVREASVCNSLVCSPDEVEFIEMPTVAPSLRGPLGSLRFQHALGALLVADWATYAERDRVSLERLAFAVARYPQGFVLARAGSKPVGYTGFFPVHSSVTHAFLQCDRSIEARAFVPYEGPDRPHVYVFNYSIIPSLKKTTASRRLLAQLERSFRALGPQALLALTVSQAGRRVAERWGLRVQGRVGNEDVLVWQAGA